MLSNIRLDLWTMSSKIDRTTLLGTIHSCIIIMSLWSTAIETNTNTQATPRNDRSSVRTIEETENQHTHNKCTHRQHIRTRAHTRSKHARHRWNCAHETLHNERRSNTNWWMEARSAENHKAASVCESRANVVCASPPTCAALCEACTVMHSAVLALEMIEVRCYNIVGPDLKNL